MFLVKLNLVLLLFGAHENKYTWPTGLFVFLAVDKIFRQTLNVDKYAIGFGVLTLYNK